jgi:hypothetical protein
LQAPRLHRVLIQLVHTKYYVKFYEESTLKFYNEESNQMYS